MDTSSSKHCVANNAVNIVETKRQ